MTGIVIYATIAILIIVLAAWLGRQRRENATFAIGIQQDATVGNPWENGCLRLAERIFDSTDYLWLRDEVRNPALARILARSRKQMALGWLQTVRRSFAALVRTPEPVPSRGSEVTSSTELLLLTLRFHFLLAYALFVVRIFGPYHRLIPSLRWARFLPGPYGRDTSYSTVDLNDILK